MKTVFGKVLLCTVFSISPFSTHLLCASECNEKSVTALANVQEQSIQFAGTVVNEHGEPLVGVSVRVTNRPSVGTITGLDGEFSLRLEKGDTVELSYVGYVSQVMTVKTEKHLKITLKEDSQLLDDVVVTALGIKRDEKALSYNVQRIKGEQLTQVKDANFVNSLTGKIAGVNIQSGAAGAGSATKVIMRGSKSISGSNNVLYVVDGMPVGNKTKATSGDAFEATGGGGGEGISDFNPEDIESISALTGPSAAALYGAAAANGVILITTKKGKEGKFSMTLSSSAEISRPFVTPRFQNRYGHAEGDERSWGNLLDKPTDFSPLDFFKTGTLFTTAATASMGNARNQTYVSFASTNSKGIVPTSGVYKYNFTGRNTANFLDDKLHWDMSASFVIQGHQNMFSQGGYGNPLLPLYLFPRGDNFEDIKVFEHYNPIRNISEQYWPYGGKIGNITSENPYWIVNRELYQSHRKRYMFFTSLAYDVTSWLNIAGRCRIDNTYSKDTKKLYASTTETLSQGTKGTYGNNQEEFRQTYADVMVNVNKSFGSYFQDGTELPLFHLTANVGASYEDYLTTGVSVGGRLNLIPNLFSAPNLVTNQQGAGESYQHTRNIAAFASMELGFKNYLYLTLTGRNDWPSQLVNSREPSVFYPSVGLSGVLSQMLRMPSFIDYLKLRGSYTEVESPISFTGLTPGTVTYKIEGGTLKPISIYPFPDFKAERTKSFEVGLNFKGFGNRLHLDATFYHSNTYNQTFLADLPETSGYTGFYVQTGNVRNRGVELSLGYEDQFLKQKKNKLSVSSYVTFTKNENKILNLVDKYENPVTGEPVALDKLSNNIRKNGSMGDIVVKGVLKRDENNRLIPTKDGSRFEIDDKQRILMGNSDPDFTMGWRNDFRYGPVSLGALIYARFGGIVQSATQSYLNAYGVSEESAQARDRGGVEVGGHMYDARMYYETIHEQMAYYTYDATNIRLQELVLSYHLDGKYLKNWVKGVTFSLFGKNLIMFYNRAPYDPEIAANTKSFRYTSEFFMVPSLRSVGASIKINL